MTEGAVLALCFCFLGSNAVRAVWVSHLSDGEAVAKMGHPTFTLFQGVLSSGNGEGRKAPMINIEPPSSWPGADGAPVLSKAGLTRFLNRAQAAVGVVGVVDVLLADDSTLKRLNRDFRGKNKATDVLSFPAPSVDDGGDAGFAGDIAISLETAGRQAERFGHGLQDEVRILLVHGLLHLSGLDHETDGGEMAGREAELRVALKLPVSLIERVMVVGKRLETGNGNGRRRFPSGMTTRKTKTKAKAEAGPSTSLRSAQDESLVGRKALKSKGTQKKVGK